MEAVALKSTPIHNPTKTHLRNPILNKTQIGFCKILRNRRGFNGSMRCSAVKEKEKEKENDCGFVEKGHLEFYGERKEKVDKKGKGKKGWGEMKAKKRMKLLKGLVDDLEKVSELGFGCDGDDQDKSLVINQAAEVLLAQLKKLRGEEEKSKKKEKSRMQDCESSSSSSSESSDSECGEVVDLKNIKGKTATQVCNQKLCNQKLPLPSTSKPALLTSEASIMKTMPLNPEKECCNLILETTLNNNSSIEVLNETTKSVQLNMGRIEVCMGGKCRKLGGPALMEEFQRIVGTEGEVVGCKCMGKCKSAPNVRVSNENVVDDSVRSPSNPLYIGVGIEDVSLIVANHFGESDKELSSPVVVLAS